MNFAYFKHFLNLIDFKELYDLNSREFNLNEEKGITARIKKYD